MELNSIEMAEADAAAAFKEYRGAFMAERNRVDGELMRGYKALMQGKQLIRLSETIKAGGANENGLPRLAIARADEQEITVSVWSDGRVTFEPPSGRIRASDRVFALPPETVPRDVANTWRTWFAMVPLVPPRFRPPHAMSGYHLLWEASWVRRSRVAPRDPALLKRVGGDLWAVLAVWDLTDLERAVLEMRS